MFGLPLELITGLGSYLLSFLGAMFKYKMELGAQLHTQMLQMAGLQDKSTEAAREYGNDKYTKTTRRMLALGIFCAVVAVPVLAGFFDVPVYVETIKEKGGFWPFTEPKKVIEYVQVNGVPVLREYIYLFTSVVGLYFGNNHGRRG